LKLGIGIFTAVRPKRYTFLFSMGECNFSIV
jgi:hypothetical protein